MTRLPVLSTRLVSKKIQKGSRIVAYLNININTFSQLITVVGKMSVTKDVQLIAFETQENAFLNMPS